MNKILVDTSVWINFLNGVKNKFSEKLKELIEKDAPVVLTPIVIQEILQGIRDDARFNEVKSALSGFEVLMIDPVEAAYEAAALFRMLRKKGITIRKSNDCLIAYYAIHHHTILLHNDSDFDKIARHSSLKIMTVR